MARPGDQHTGARTADGDASARAGSVWDLRPVLSTTDTDDVGPESASPARSTPPVVSGQSSRRPKRPPAGLVVERPRSRWSVDPRFLIAIVVVAVPAYLAWDAVRVGSADPEGEETEAAASPADEATAGGEETEVPDFTDGELVGTWSERRPDAMPDDAQAVDGPATPSPESGDQAPPRPDTQQLTDEPTNNEIARADASMTVIAEPRPAAGLDESTNVGFDTEPMFDLTVLPSPDITTPDADLGPRVDIVTRVEPCRFGTGCLVAGFTIAGFEQRPAEFVCEFGSGSRFAFPLTATSIDFACATGEVGDRITIEVGGIRSETVEHR